MEYNATRLGAEKLRGERASFAVDYFVVVVLYEVVVA
jgi:hypothetical protein